MYIVYRKGSLSKIAVVETKKEAEKFKGSMYDIIKAEDSNDIVVKDKDNKVKLKKYTPKIPTQEEINHKITSELNNTTPELLEIFEDIVNWAEKEGFILSEQKKQLMDFRKEKRKGIK